MYIHYLTAQPTFKSEVKRLYKEGKLPSVEYGIYGGLLDEDNVTDEHVIPKSKGGTKKTSNMALATAKNNFDRGNRPLKEVLTKENLDRYLKQFENVDLPNEGFNGWRYIKGLLNSITIALNMK